jgi:hypothetical protein
MKCCGILVNKTTGKYHGWSSSPTGGNNKFNSGDDLVWIDCRVNSGTDESPSYEERELPFDESNETTYYWDFDDEYFKDSDGNQVVSEED